MDVNILAQIGFVVLIGLAAKNAILIVEFARQGEDEGHERREAAVGRGAHAAAADPDDLVRVHLRRRAAGRSPPAPAFEMRQSLGTAVFFGMIGVTMFGLLFTPLFYVVCRRLGEIFSWRPNRSRNEQPG